MVNILKAPLALLIILFLFTGSVSRKDTGKTETCVSQDEYKLYELINSYRKSKNLPRVPLSKSLTYVAQVHAKDLAENNLIQGNCNAHSWSAKGKWSSCCYSPDHAKAQCMWDKPRELTTYQGDGYEIAYFTSATVVPAQALEAWKESKGHNMIIVNSSQWKSIKFNAMGVGIYKGYACVWFGSEKDIEGEPGKCAGKK